MAVLNILYKRCFILILSLVIITWVTIKLLEEDTLVLLLETSEEVQCNYGFPELIQIKDNELHRKVLKYPRPEFYTCCYGTLHWRDTFSGYLQMNTTCINFTSRFSVNDTFGFVECKTKEDLIYRDFYFFLDNHPLDAKPQKSDSNILSVIVLILGQTSRHAFHQAMSESSEYLTNTVGANEFVRLETQESSYANLQKLLYGKSLETKPIWMEYKHAGYVTAYGDDCMDPAAKLTPPNTIGDRFHPFDFNWESFYAASLGRTDTGRRALSGAVCIGSQPTYVRLLDYAGQFVRRRRRNSRAHFGVFYIDAALRYDRGNLRHADRHLVRFLREISHNLAVDTVLMLVGDNAVLERSAGEADGDSGGRQSARRSGGGGNYVKSPPLFYFLLPISYKIEYPDVAATLEWNSKRMVTYADIHSTLRDLIKDTREWGWPDDGLLKKMFLGRVGANRGL